MPYLFIRCAHIYADYKVIKFKLFFINSPHNSDRLRIFADELTKTTDITQKHETFYPTACGSYNLTF